MDEYVLWKNKETWCVYVHLSKSLYESSRNVIIRGATRNKVNWRSPEDALRYHVREVIVDPRRYPADAWGMFGEDLAGIALERVDWRAITESLSGDHDDRD